MTLTAGASGSAGLQLKPEAEGAQGAAGFDAAGAVNLDLARDQGRAARNKYTFLRSFTSRVSQIEVSQVFLKC